jgi:beta-mannanase
VTVEPYSTPGRGPVLESIIAGQADAQLGDLAQAVRAASPRVVLVRWGHEMDLSGSSPWAANDPALYRAAYRHVVETFRAAGARNSRFVWSPAGEPGAERFFPGSDVVDYVGLTILADPSWDSLAALPPQSFQDLLRPRYQRVEALGKPIIIAELGVSGSVERQSAWLADAARSLATFPQVRGLVYFDEQNPPAEQLTVLPDWHMPTPALDANLAPLRIGRPGGDP